MNSHNAIYSELQGSPTKEFVAYSEALGGCDGGNPDSELWFCGIEPGGEPSPIPDARSWAKGRFPAWSREDKRNHDGWPWSYGRKVAKTALAYYGHEDFSELRSYVAEDLYEASGSTFKLNLYPLNFRNVNAEWPQTRTRETGFLNKTVYKAWCIQNRFAMFRDLLAEFSPKVLICTGMRHRAEFMDAFCDGGRFGSYQEDKVRIEGSARESACRAVTFIASNSSTQVIVTPFFGQGGLMSNASFMSLGRLARQLSSG